MSSGAIERLTGELPAALRGLSQAQAAQRLASEGFNEIEPPRRRTAWRIALEVAREPMLQLLMAAGAIYVVLGDRAEALMLLGFVAITASITVMQERRAERVLEALRDLASPRALVIRDGERVRIAGREVVRGDLLVLVEGDRVPADALLLSASDLRADESLLTGESVPVDKRGAMQQDLPSADAQGQRPRPGGDGQPHVFSGTLIVGGQAIAEVTAAGVHSEIGRVGVSLAAIPPEATPLQRQVFARPQFAGRWFGTMCLSEPQAGSSLSDVATRAVPDGLDALGPRFRPFSHAATADLPLSRLLRLSLFQVSVGIAIALLVGTLNRVMIVELGVGAWLVALMVSLPVLVAPLRALVGFRSDTHRSALGWRRVPYVWMGSCLQFGGLAIMPFALLLLTGRGEPGSIWLGHIGAAAAFLMVGAGVQTTQTAGLALATDLASAETRPRVVALMYVMLLVGMVGAGVVYSVALANFSETRLVQVIQSAAVLSVLLNVVALWKQEPRDPGRNRDRTADAPGFRATWQRSSRFYSATTPATPPRAPPCSAPSTLPAGSRSPPGQWHFPISPSASQPISWAARSRWR
jgi:hypothetical protein